MGKVTVYCLISGCAPEVAGNLRHAETYGPIVTTVLDSFADPHELRSQDDLCVIAPVDASGQLLYPEDEDEPRLPHIDMDTEIRVVPHCVMGDSWDFGFVDAPEGDQSYLVSYGLSIMVQTYALDIMALATHGRMTPLRLWRLAMVQGHENSGLPHCLDDVYYGDIHGEWDQYPAPFPGFYTADMLEYPDLMEMEKFEDVEAVRQQIVHQGQFWLWMAPDRFPISPTEHDVWLPALHPQVDASACRSAIESIPCEVLVSIVSSLPILSIFELASTSWLLRTKILGNDYLACVWLYTSAPWWIPVLTQTPKKGLQTATPRTYLASGRSPHVQLTFGFPAGLDWAYISRCIRSGSMRNRKRIWKVALDIERTTDLAGF